MLKFTRELAQELLTYTDPYPIYLDDAWQWLGYPDKESARNDSKLLREGIDYIHLWKPKWSTSTDEELLLTIEAFLMLASVACTQESSDAIDCIVDSGWTYKGNQPHGRPVINHQ